MRIETIIQNLWNDFGLKPVFENAGDIVEIYVEEEEVSSFDMEDYL